MAYYFVYVPLFLVSLLPMWLLYGISYVAYLFVYYLIPYRKDVVMTNLRNSFPEKGEDELREICKKFYRLFADRVFEVIKLMSLTTAGLEKRITLANVELLDKLYDERRSVIAALGHCGNWEMLNTLPFKLKQKVNTAYKPLSNKIFDRWFIELRNRFHLTSIPAQRIAKHILSNKEKAEFYLFLADQCPERVNDKYRFTFLNQSTAMYNGVEKLATGTDSAVVYIHVRMDRRGHYTMTFQPLCDNPKETGETEITRKYAQMLEDNIREQPHIWLWSHRRWKR